MAIEQMEPEELERLKTLATERLKAKNYVGAGGQPPLDLLENEITKIQQEEQEKISREGEALGEERYDKYAEEERKKAQLKRLGMLGEMQPDLSNRAYELFPNLKDITGQPRENYVESDEPQQEAAPKAPEEVEAEMAPKKAPEVSAKTPSAPQPQAQAPQEVVEMQQPPVSQEPSIEELMRKSDENKQKAEMDLSIAKFRDAIIGAGGTGFKSDLSDYERKIKESKKPIEDYKLKTELQEAKSQAEDKKAKNDPNSAISKLVRKTLEKMGTSMKGFENVSYAQLEKLYPSVVNAFNTKLAAEAKKEEAVAMRLFRQSQKDAQNVELDSRKKESAYKDLYSKTAKVLESNQAKLFNRSVATNKLIDEAMANWGKSGDQYKVSTSAAFMSYAKTAQQDDSVVRESDMKVLAGGINYGSLGSLLQKFQAKTEGSSFSPSELKAFKAVMNTIRNIQSKELQKSLNPINKKAEQSGIERDLLIDDEMYDNIYNTPKTPEERLKDLEEQMSKSSKRIEELKSKK